MQEGKDQNYICLCLRRTVTGKFRLRLLNVMACHPSENLLLGRVSCATFGVHGVFLSIGHMFRFWRYRACKESRQTMWVDVVAFVIYHMYI